MLDRAVLVQFASVPVEKSSVKIPFAAETTVMGSDAGLIPPTFPTASTASTRYVWVLPATRPVSVKVTVVVELL